MIATGSVFKEIDCKNLLRGATKLNIVVTSAMDIEATDKKDEKPETKKRALWSKAMGGEAEEAGGGALSASIFNQRGRHDRYPQAGRERQHHADHSPGEEDVPRACPRRHGRIPPAPASAAGISGATTKTRRAKRLVLPTDFQPERDTWT
jgi:hypothetical protein